MKVTTLLRVFKYEGQELPDLGASFSPAQVKDVYTANFPELVNAEIEGPNEIDGKLVYTFKRTTGTKGLGQQEIALPFVQRLALVAAGQVDPMEPRSRVALEQSLAEKHQAFGRALSQTTNGQRRRATLPGLPSEALPLLL